jgi:hypothetical protein
MTPQTAVIVFSGGHSEVVPFGDLEYRLRKKLYWGIQHVVVGEQIDFKPMMQKWQEDEQLEEMRVQEMSERQEYERLKKKFEG